MGFARSRKGVKAAAILGGLWTFIKFLYEAFDFLAGKIGWLGVFTSPEDFETMVERAPDWIGVPLDFFGPSVAVFGSKVTSILAAVTSYNGLMAILIAGLVLLVLDVERILSRVSFLKFKVRSKMSESVWISKTDAYSLLKDSEWGKLVSPHVVTTRSVLGNLSALSGISAMTESTVHGMSDK